MNASVPLNSHSTMMTACHGNTDCGYWPWTSEIPSQRASNADFDVFFDAGLNKRLNKRRWFEMPWCSLWRYCNAIFRSICRSNETEKWSAWQQNCHSQKTYIFRWYIPVLAISLSNYFKQQKHSLRCCYSKCQQNIYWNLVRSLNLNKCRGYSLCQRRLLH